MIREGFSTLAALGVFIVTGHTHGHTPQRTKMMGSGAAPDPERSHPFFPNPRLSCVMGRCTRLGGTDRNQDHEIKIFGFLFCAQPTNTATLGHTHSNPGAYLDIAPWLVTPGQSGQNPKK